jgi:hypothetical protein
VVAPEEALDGVGPCAVGPPAAASGIEEEAAADGASFEQAAASVAKMQETAKRRFTKPLLPARAPSVKSNGNPAQAPLAGRQESTVIPSFSRSCRYGSLML